MSHAFSLCFEALPDFFGLFCFFKDLFIYLEVIVTERVGGWRERERSLVHWSTSQMATMTGSEPGQSRDPGASSRSPPSLVQGPEHLGYLPLLSQAHQQGAGLEVEQLGLEPAPTWDAGITGSGSTCYSTMLTSPPWINRNL